MSTCSPFSHTASGVEAATAETELPNAAAVQAAGINLDLRTARLVLIVVSRMMALTANSRLRNTHYTNMVYEAMHLVMPALCEDVEVELPGRRGRLEKNVKRAT